MIFTGICGLQHERAALVPKECYALLVLTILLAGIVNDGVVVHGAKDNKHYDRMPTNLAWAVPGKDIELPCDVTPPIPSDSVHMVFWFKDNVVMPLYSLDARKGLTVADHFASSDDLGSRSYFIITDADPSAARLKIKKVTASDEGIFRCRVDFINSPTRNFRFNLTLVEQPSTPRVFDAEGKEVISVAGPFLEGQELFLSCEVTGGRPAPSLIWYYNGTILDAVIDTTRASLATVNQLLITRVDRSMKGARLECRATVAASEMAGEITREVPISVYLKPNKVKIITSNKLMASNIPNTVKCETSGSYPPALLTWLLNGKPIRNAEVAEEETMKSSRSTLNFSPFPEDDGKELICRADNPRFPGGSLIDRRYIKVAYPPRVAVRLESDSTNPVREGSYVVIQCEAEATPPAHSYNWYFNGHIMVLNETAGVIPNSSQLNLTHITRISEGEYSCAALNTEGETYSAPYHLQVQYAPRCKQGHDLMRVGAVTHETVVVQCQVDAVPTVTRFHWTYNTSRGVLPVQGAKQQNVGGLSTLHFTPGAQDVDSLACWATNAVGRQVVPCLFYIVPAFNPEPPRNCLLQNATGGGLEVACTAGRDGGLQQSFVLEVIDTSVAPTKSTVKEKKGEDSAAAIVVTTLSDQEHYTPLYRVLGDKPLFRLQGLQSDREYQLLVYAENAKGRSNPPVLLSNVRVSDDGSNVGAGALDGLGPAGGGGQFAQSGDLSTSDNLSFLSTAPTLTVILLSLALLAILLILSIVVAATILACRNRPTSHNHPGAPSSSCEGGSVTLRRSRRSSKPPDELELQSEAGFNEGFHRRSAQYRASVYALQVDGEAVYGRQVSTGPDLILAPSTFTQQQF